MAKKEKKEEAAAGAPAWMATFSDLVTLLFCFFVLLYAMSNVDQAKFQALAGSFSNSTVQSLVGTGGSGGITNLLGNGIMEMPVVETQVQETRETYDESKNKMDKLYSDFKTYFSENELQDKIDIIESENYIDLILKDGLLFDKGKDTIKVEAISILNKIADQLLLDYKDSDIEITGHTDNDPINVPRFPDNWNLSAARAINVGNFFIKEKGFSPKKIAAKGRGEFDPLVPNDSDSNKSKNRRVEIRIFSSFYSNEKN